MPITDVLVLHSESKQLCNAENTYQGFHQVPLTLALAAGGLVVSVSSQDSAGTANDCSTPTGPQRPSASQHNTAAVTLYTITQSNRRQITHSSHPRDTACS